MGPVGIVECHPGFDDFSGLEAVIDLVGIDRFLHHAAPQAFDKDVVQMTAFLFAPVAIATADTP
ncbi:hypothetical protein AB838_16500 [Rhodobacteraceae bacterium (ex Bugula neritina AB1)]|nr:hypothetical protein AB838_16500 [Rhodobacteraceae bacterium (ex Bugula neritina AB1)]